MERFKREVGRYRRDGFQQQRKLVCICTEGTVTERSYLECLEFAFKKKLKSQGKEDDTKFSFVYATENKKTAPAYLLNKMKKKLESLTRNKVASAWIISDKDGWSDKQLNEIKDWIDKDAKKRHWILSNPRIEYWLEFHFQSDSEKQIFDKGYKKKIKETDFTFEQIVLACKRARGKKRNLNDLYTQKGSLMYEIVEYVGKEYQLCSEDSRGVVRWIEEKS